MREGREMAYVDAFSGFSMFGKVIWATVLLGLIFTAIFVVPTAVIVGGAAAGSGILAGLGVVVLLAAMVAYAYLGIGWVYVFPVIVDRGLGVTEAMARVAAWSTAPAGGGPSSCCSCCSWSSAPSASRWASSRSSARSRRSCCTRSC